MQLGFGMLEVGTVRARSVENILFKYLGDASIGAIIWLCFGWTFSTGAKEDPDAFIGTEDWALHESDSFRDFFFSWCFAATAATIVSGSVAERITIQGYLAYSIFITGFIYPVVVYWVWTGGWLYFNDENEMGIMDFAGSGVVHMVGGFSGLIGAIILGPRKGDVSEHHSVPFVVFGTFILWFGWYGFNCGSTLGISGSGAIATRVAVNTTLAAASGGLTVLGYSKLAYGRLSTALMCNGILGGLVSITANCHVIQIGWSIAIGVVGGLVYVGSSKMVKLAGIDDVLDAGAVHGFCGMWGVIATGIFYDKDLVSAAYDPIPSDLSKGEQFGKQLLGAIVIAAWTICLSGGLFYLVKVTFGLRISEEDEEKGLDFVEHMGNAWHMLNSGMDAPSKPELLKKDSAGDTWTIEMPSTEKSPELQKGGSAMSAN